MKTILNNIIGWIKTNKTKAEIIIVVTLIALVAFFVWRAISRYQSKQAAMYELIYNKYKDSVRYYKDKVGNTVAVVSEKKDYLAETSEKDKEKIDSLIKLLKIKPKEVTKYIEISSQGDFSSSTGKRDSSIRDTNYYSFSDRWLTYRAEASDSLRFKEFNVRDSLYGFFVDHKVGNKTFSELNIQNSNPKVTITGLQNISYEQPKEYSRISIGISAGMMINKKPYFGIGLNYDLIRFKKKSR